MHESLANFRSAFYALTSLFGIVAFFGSYAQARKENTSILNLIKEVAKSTWHCLSRVLGCPVIALWFVLFYMHVLFFRCLPLSFKAPVRSGRRYAVKTALGAEQKTEFMLSELTSSLTKNKATAEPYQNSGGTGSDLSQFLAVYDMLIMVARHLHYTDLISLSSVSKSVRESVLPSNDVSHRIKMFRLYACEPNGKTTCWSCTNQICDDCQEDFPLRQAIIFHHVDNCVPYCASCYHMYIVRHPRLLRNKTKGDPPCNHAPKQPNQGRKLFRNFLNRRAYYTEPLDSYRTVRQVCHTCSRLAEEEIFVRKGKSAVGMIKRGLKSNGDKWEMCANLGCGQSLGTGPRYWICKLSGCNKECRSTIHQAWGIGKDKNVVGGDLV
jgi:hypothetical protein